MSKKTPLFLLAASFLILGAACTKQVTVNSESSVNASTGAENANENLNTNSTNANGPINTNESTNTNTSPSDNNGPTIKGSLRVDTPKSDMQVVSPFEVTGQSDTDKVYVRVKNASGTTIMTLPVTVRGGAFTVHVTLTLSSSRAMTLDIFQKDSAGAEVNLISFPVNVKVPGSEINTNASTNTNSSTNNNANTNTGY